MNKNWVKCVVSCVIAVLIIAGGYGLADHFGWFWPGAEVAFRADNEKIGLGVAMGGEQYLDRAQNGTRTGTQLRPITLLNSAGKEVNLFAGDKKVLLAYGIPGCSSCVDYYPILQDWAQRYRDQLTVVLVYWGEPKEAEVQEHVAAGIEVIIDRNQLHGIAEPGSRFWSLLVSPEGIVEGRFAFEVYRWQEYDQLVQEFVQGPWRPVIETEIRLGEVLKVPPLVDYRGQMFCLEDYRTKPTLLVVLSPGCQTCSLTYQFLNNLRETYEDRLNLVVVINYSSNEMCAAIRQYRDLYKLKRLAESEDAKTPEELVQGQGLEGFPLYFDHQHSVFNYLKAWITPTMLVLDRNSVLVEIFGLGMARGDNPETLDLMMEQILLNLW